MLSVLHSDSAINQEDSLLTILCYQIPTQAPVQLYIVNSYENMSSYTASKDAEVWIAKDKMDRFCMFTAYFFSCLFKLLSIIFLRQEMQLVFVSTMASVLRFLLCRRNVLPSCLEFQSGYDFSMKYIAKAILAGYKHE